MSTEELETIIEKEPATKEELADQIGQIVRASVANAGDVVDSVKDPVAELDNRAAAAVERLDRRVTECQDAVRNLYEITRSLSAAMNGIQTTMRSLQVQITQLNAKR